MIHPKNTNINYTNLAQHNQYYSDILRVGQPRNRYWF